MTSLRSGFELGPLPATARWGRALGATSKRLLDLVGSFLLLLVLTPLLLPAMLAVRLSSPGPVLFRQTRLGRDGRPFVMLKLRTMRANCPDAVHREYVTAMLRGEDVAVDGIYKLPTDSRVTRIGKLLRRTSVDELPQLWNVLRGDMSLVGPRPVLAWESELFPRWARERYAVRPGVTGLWQVSGRNRLTMQEGLALDVEYAARHGLLVDLVILLRTVTTVLGGGAR